MFLFLSLLLFIYFHFVMILFFIFLHWKHSTQLIFSIELVQNHCLCAFLLRVSSADNENHTKGESPKASSAPGPQEQLWRASQAPAPAPAHPSVKLQIQPQSISQRNHTLSRK